MEMSASFAAIGFFVSLWIWSKTNNKELASGVFFFFTMELLQAVQYFFIAPDLSSPICETRTNQFLTMLGFLHICLQPYFTHVINASLTRHPKYLDIYVVIKRLALMGGAMLFARFLFADYWGNTLGNELSTEWVRGKSLCTYHGNYHLAWSIPLADPTYIIPGIGLHSFLMFAPFFALYEKKGMIIQGLFLFLTGPYMAGWITSNLMEQASIWCFFSIAQIGVMLFCIRETLIINWGKNSSGHNSLLKAETSPEVTVKKSNQKGVKAF